MRKLPTAITAADVEDEESAACLGRPAGRSSVFPAGQAMARRAADLQNSEMSEIVAISSDASLGELAQTHPSRAGNGAGRWQRMRKSEKGA